MSEHIFRDEDFRPLRCQVCGEQVGVVAGDEPGQGLAIVRCYRCAAVEAAEAITRNEAAES